MPDWKDAIRQRLGDLRLEPSRESEIVEELAQHLDDRYRELLAVGATPEESSRGFVGLSESELWRVNFGGSNEPGTREQQDLRCMALARCEEPRHRDRGESSGARHRR